jgi:hypothetical protein
MTSAEKGNQKSQGLINCSLTQIRQFKIKELTGKQLYCKKKLSLLTDFAKANFATARDDIHTEAKSSFFPVILDYFLLLKVVGKNYLFWRIFSRFFGLHVI